MTIAVCYLSPEGLVMGADSTTTSVLNGGNHYFNHAQKVFEVGEGSSLALVTWGMAGFGTVSYRTLVALLGDDLGANPTPDVAIAAQRWIDLVWPYFIGLPEFTRIKALEANDQRTPEEEEEFIHLSRALVVGFCIGGYCLPDRLSRAFEIVLDPLKGKPNADELAPLTHRWWGVPNIIQRLIFGGDVNLQAAILSSGMWTGTNQDLTTIFGQQALIHPILPIREAVDFVHTCIRSTGKAMRFSDFPQVCGGPPEIAVITTDRKFRWVRHKTWDTAIEDGG